jgi:hypothetical protein
MLVDQDHAVLRGFDIRDTGDIGRAELCSCSAMLTPSFS